jgi:hypothetical protein
MTVPYLYPYFRDYHFVELCFYLPPNVLDEAEAGPQENEHFQLQELSPKNAKTELRHCKAVRCTPTLRGSFLEV